MSRQLAASIVVIMLLCIGCNPIDYTADRAADRCQEILEEKLPEVREEAWDICTSFYEDIIIPGLQSELEGTVNELREEIEELMHQNIYDILIELGCTQTDNMIWDCSASMICE